MIVGKFGDATRDACDMHACLRSAGKTKTEATPLNQFLINTFSPSRICFLTKTLWMQ